MAMSGSFTLLWTGLANLVAQIEHRAAVDDHTRGWWKTAVILALGLLLLTPSSVSAHAVPRATSPGANAVVQQAPQEIAIRFSERVEARASSLQVFDAQGMRIDDGTAAVPPDDPWLYRVVLPSLGTGVYTVSWRVMSADDGHVTAGAYVFVVGGTAIPQSPAAGQVIAVTGWLDVLARWMGMFRGSGVDRHVDRGIGVLAETTTPCPIAHVCAAMACYPVSRSWSLPIREVESPFCRGERRVRLGMLMSSTIGQITAAKFGVTVLLVGALLGYWRSSRRRTWMWGLALLLMVLLLMSDALVSHAAATIAWKSLAIGAELVHLLGVILWVGGLGYFATLFWWSTFREASLGSKLAWAIPAFSLLAVGSVGLLTISGLYLAQLYLDSLDQLLATSYGRVLLIKLAVVALMMVLGGYHQFIVHPRIVASLDQAGYSPDRSSQQFRKTLRIEALLGLSALPLAALLGTTSPPSHPPPHIDKTLQQVRVVDDAQLSVEVWPLRPGSNAIRVTVTGRDGQTLADATAVVLQLQAAASEAAPLGFTLDRESPGVFVKKDMVLGIEGKWKGQVTVQRHGA